MVAESTDAPLWLIMLGNVGGIVAGGAVLIGVLFLVLKRYVFNPIKLTYVIPKRDYRMVLFEGAGPVEQEATCLTVGIGTYRIMHLVKPKSDISVNPVILRVCGPDRNKPLPGGSDNPHVIEEIVGRMDIDRPTKEYRNWNGEVYPSHRGWPIHVMKGERWYLGNRLETFGPWQGEIVLSFPILDSRIIQQRLPFYVVDEEGRDCIPFLRGTRTKDGKTKERAAKEASD